MLKRIRGGIDFSEPGQQVLVQAAQLAKRLGAPLTAMHVVARPDPPLFDAYVPMGDPSWFHSFVPNAQKWLDEWLEPYLGCEGLIQTGNPAKCLADQTDADILLVVGHKGTAPWKRSAWEALLSASSAARQGTCWWSGWLLQEHPQKAPSNDQSRPFRDPRIPA